MCGICGISTRPNNQLDLTALTTNLLKGIEDRGPHATGVTYSGESKTHTHKAATTASKYVKTLKIAPLATVVLGHTRWATQGSPTNNDNNHPIVVPTQTPGETIHGIHNGVLWNDDELFTQIGPNSRIAQVDSEAAFAYIARSGIDTMSALNQIEGSAALAWVNTAEPETLHLARIDSSPLIIAHTITGELLFASTAKCLTNAAQKAGLNIKALVEIDEGTYLKVRYGSIVSKDTFRLPKLGTTRQYSQTELLALGIG